MSISRRNFLGGLAGILAAGTAPLYVPNLKVWTPRKPFTIKILPPPASDFDGDEINNHLLRQLGVDFDGDTYSIVDGDPCLQSALSGKHRLPSGMDTAWYNNLYTVPLYASLNAAGKAKADASIARMRMPVIRRITDSIVTGERPVSSYRTSSRTLVTRRLGDA